MRQKQGHANPLAGYCPAKGVSLVAMNDATKLPLPVERVDPLVADQLLPLVYEELRRIAAARLAHEKPGQTLSATALVHEAYLKLVGDQPDRQWPGRTYFLGAAAEAMRRILVDQARKKAAAKRGGQDARREPLDSDLAETAPAAEVVAVHDALDQLQAEDSLAAELVKLHYFGGLPIEEAGELLGMSRASAYRLWTFARTWLKACLDDEAGDSPAGQK
jgi:RNA polymerase sigma factor (TIGR02999 family)